MHDDGDDNDDDSGGGGGDDENNNAEMQKCIPASDQVAMKACAQAQTYIQAQHAAHDNRAREHN